MPKRKKNADAGWLPPLDDPEWRDYLAQTLWAPLDLDDMAGRQAVPTRLAFPFVYAPDVALSKNAQALLDEALRVFHERLLFANAPKKIVDMLAPNRRLEYEQRAGSPDRFLLYLRREREWYDDAGSSYHVPVTSLYTDDAFDTTIDVYLTEAAGKAFASHVSRFPGCVARRVKLTPEEKARKGFKGKTSPCDTRVAVSAEGCEAFREGRVREPSPAQIAALRFYKSRCETHGVPKGWGRVLTTYPTCISLTPRHGELHFVFDAFGVCDLGWSGAKDADESL